MMTEKQTSLDPLDQFTPEEDLQERVRKLEAALAQAAPSLPPDAILRNGRMFHSWDNTDADGKVTHHERPATSDPIEARAKRWDFYHQDFGWVKEGYKLYTDRTPENIMGDASVAQMDPNIVKELSNAS